MARRSWLKTLSHFFRKKISKKVQTSQRSLVLARKCMEHAKRMTSPSVPSSLRFNHGVCAYLAAKLEVSYRWSESCAVSYPEFMGIVKLLYRCAKEVEAFIESCCQGNWVRTAIVLLDVSEHVSSLCFELEFCTFLFLNYNRETPPWVELTELDALFKSEAVREIVRHDQITLLRRLQVRDPTSNSSEEALQLVNCLSQRLNQHLSGVVQSEVWEIDFSTLWQVQKLASGSIGTVRKSIWLGIEVAEKMFYGTDHPSFRNEVEILAGLAHPNIVPLLGYAVHESRCFIVMELMDGDVLHLMEERFRQNPTREFPFSTAEAVDLMLQTAQGMLYLHENRVVHRDLKSQNILVKCRKDIDAEYIYAKVADFGLSKTKERSSSYSNLTTNTGTTRWMALELMTQEDDDIDERTELRYPFKVDVYSFGMVCCEILTGRVPFSGISSLRDIKRMVLAGVRPNLPDECLPDLRTLIHECWQPDATNRPSFVEICKRLRCVKYLLLRGLNTTCAEYEGIVRQKKEEKEVDAGERTEEKEINAC